MDADQLSSAVDQRDFRIRRAKGEDAMRLAHFLSQMFALTFGAQNKPADLAAYLSEAFGQTQQADEIADGSTQFWLAEDVRDLIGCAQLKLGSRSADVSAPRQAELGRLYVDTRWHGSGLGLALLNSCIDAALAWDADVLWLGVWENNPRAIAFYEKHGFRSVGDQSFQLGSDVQRDVVMVRRLT